MRCSVGCYGRIRAQKGTDAFVEAMLPILPDHPDFVALVIARDREIRRFRRKARKIRAVAEGLYGPVALFCPESAP